MYIFEVSPDSVLLTSYFFLPVPQLATNPVLGADTLEDVLTYRLRSAPLQTAESSSGRLQCLGFEFDNYAHFYSPNLHFVDPGLCLRSPYSLDAETRLLSPMAFPLRLFRIPAVKDLLSLFLSVYRRRGVTDRAIQDGKRRRFILQVLFNRKRFHGSFPPALLSLSHEERIVLWDRVRRGQVVRTRRIEDVFVLRHLFHPLSPQILVKKNKNYYSVHVSSPEPHRNENTGTLYQKVIYNFYEADRPFVKFSSPFKYLIIDGFITTTALTT